MKLLSLTKSQFLAALALVLVVKMASAANTEEEYAAGSLNRRDRIIWVGSGNAFGDSDTGSENTTKSPGPGDSAGEIKCTGPGYFADPASSSSFVECKYNPLTQKYEASKQSCPPGTRFEASPPQCVRI